MSSAVPTLCELATGAVLSGATVMMVSSAMAEVVTRALPSTSLRMAPGLTWSCRVPALVGVACTAKTPGVVSMTAPMVTAAVPALPKSAAVTVAAFMSSLKAMV